MAMRTGNEQRLQLTMPVSTGDRVVETRLTPELGADREISAIVSIWRGLTY
jgi:hypothetical protein